MTGVSITVDVDGEAGLPDGGRHHARAALEPLRAHATASTAGCRGSSRCSPATARRRRSTSRASRRSGIPRRSRSVLAAGHEVGHHGHAHRGLHRLTPPSSGATCSRGSPRSRLVCGAAPRGYRAPAWELTPDTLALLGEHGFRHDSSLMGDDRPYPLAAGRRRCSSCPCTGRSTTRPTSRGRPIRAAWRRCGSRRSTPRRPRIATSR